MTAVILPFIISGESMYPTLQTGDKVFFEAIAPEALKIGELLVFKNPRDQIPCVHRLLWIGKAHLLTAGDADWCVDTGVPFDHLLGRVLRVEPEDPRLLQPKNFFPKIFFRKIHFILKKCLLYLKESDSFVVRKFYFVLSFFWIKWFIKRRA